MVTKGDHMNQKRDQQIASTVEKLLNPFLSHICLLHSQNIVHGNVTQTILNNPEESAFQSLLNSGESQKEDVERCIQITIEFLEKQMNGYTKSSSLCNKIQEIRSSQSCAEILDHLKDVHFIKRECTDPNCQNEVQTFNTLCSRCDNEHFLKLIGLTTPPSPSYPSKTPKRSNTELTKDSIRDIGFRATKEKLNAPKGIRSKVALCKWSKGKKNISVRLS